MSHPENHEFRNTNQPIEGVVLDADGHVVHDPHESNSKHSAHPKFKMAWSGPRSMGLLPKLLMGTAFIALLVLGLTISAVALGILLVGSIAKLFITPKRR